MHARGGSLLAATRIAGSLMQSMDPIETMERAMQALVAGDDARAEVLARSVLQVESDNPDANYALGLIAQRRGDLENAERLVRAAIAVEPAAFWYHAALAELRLAQHDPLGAVPPLQEAARLQPDSVAVVSALATLLGRLGLHDELRQTLKQLSALRPDAAAAQQRLLNGIALLHLSGQQDAAAAEFEAALKIDPNLSAAHLQLAPLLFQFGQVPEALHHYHQLDRLSPPEPPTASAMLFASNYDPHVDVNALFE